MPAAIEIIGLTKRFGRITALDDVSVRFERGEITALVGENGCGKTTLLRILAGMLRQDRGRVLILGRVAPRRGYRRFWQPSNLGFGFQFPRTLSQLDLASNLLIGASPGMGRSLTTALIGEGNSLLQDRQAAESLSQSATGRAWETIARVLSFGERRRLELARVRIADPKVVILDEPFAGLDAMASSAVARTIGDWRRDGRTVILTGHHLSTVGGLADRVVELQRGKVVHDASSKGRSSLKEELIPVKPRPLVGPTTTVLVTDGLSAGYEEERVFVGFNLLVESGQVVAFVGPNGSGKSTALRALAGLAPWTKGKIEFLPGTAMWSKAPSGLLGRKAGMSFALQGARIFPQMTVSENLQLAVQYLGTALERERAIEHVLELFPILKGWDRRRAGMLSGGQRQLLSLAQAMATRPAVLLLDEPSAGLSEEHYETMIAAVQRALEWGAGVVIVEHDRRVVSRLANVIWRFTLGQPPQRVEAF